MEKIQLKWHFQLIFWPLTKIPNLILVPRDIDGDIKSQTKWPNGVIQIRHCNLIHKPKLPMVSGRERKNNLEHQKRLLKISSSIFCLIIFLCLFEWIRLIFYFCLSVYFSLSLAFSFFYDILLFNILYSLDFSIFSFPSGLFFSILPSTFKVQISIKLSSVQAS